MQKKGKTLYHSTRVFGCLFALMMYMALVSRFHLCTSISLDTLQLYTFFFLLRCFDQSTVIVVTMFSRRINERLQMNECSGKAMDCNLSGF